MIKYYCQCLLKQSSTWLMIILIHDQKELNKQRPLQRVSNQQRGNSRQRGREERKLRRERNQRGRPQRRGRNQPRQKERMVHLKQRVSIIISSYKLWLSLNIYVLQCFEKEVFCRVVLSNVILTNRRRRGETRRRNSCRGGGDCRETRG